MSAETIPADVLAIVRDFMLRMPVPSGYDTVSRAMARAILTDRATRPAEHAAPVAEAGDGEVVSWPHHLNEAMDALTSAFQWLKNIRYGISCAEEAVASTEKMIAHVYEAIDAEPPLVRLSTLEAERARADELHWKRDFWENRGNKAFQRLAAAKTELAASGRCIDDMTTRLAAAEQRAANALARAEKAAEDERDRLYAEAKGMEGVDSSIAAGWLRYLGPAMLPADRAILRAARDAQTATDGGDNG